MSRTGKSIETESRLLVAGEDESKELELSANRGLFIYLLSWYDENVLELDSGDGCTT